MKMRCWGVLGLIMCCAPAASAQALFGDGFEPEQIVSPIPRVNGVYQLPDGPTSRRLTWLMGELQPGQTTSDQEILDNFDDSWLQSIPLAQTRQFIDSIRASYPGGVILDVVSLSPIRATVVIDSPGAPPPYGFMNIGVRFTSGQKITLLGVNAVGGSLMFAQDASLSMSAAADKFMTLSANPALLVGRIDGGGQCMPIQARSADQPRATASVFKSWILAELGRAIAQGRVSSADNVPLVASELAPGGLINSEPLGTSFTVAELATLMMGNSDNTATDLMHELLGRSGIGEVVQQTAIEAPELLLPFLNISEQFHIFRSFDLSTALSYVNGSEPFQAQFLADQIEPLGPQSGGAFFHSQLLTRTWQATPNDICRLFAYLRQLPRGSEALTRVEAAFGASVAQPYVRDRWDRVWYKGGSLASGSADNFHVLTHVWMLERAGEEPKVLIALSNDDGGGIDAFEVQSVTARMLELLADLP